MRSSTPGHCGVLTPPAFPPSPLLSLLPSCLDDSIWLLVHQGPARSCPLCGHVQVLAGVPPGPTGPGRAGLGIGIILPICVCLSAAPVASGCALSAAGFPRAPHKPCASQVQHKWVVKGQGVGEVPSHSPACNERQTRKACQPGWGVRAKDIVFLVSPNGSSFPRKFSSGSKPLNTEQRLKDTLCCSACTGRGGGGPFRCLLFSTLPGN